jgi:putative transposase
MKMKAVKAVRFRYTPTERVRGLMERFREMVNEALRIGYERKPRSRFSLITMAYCELKRYGLHTHYILSACECAFAMLRNRRWKRLPRVRRPFLKLDSQTYVLNYMLLRIPEKPREFILIPLIGGEYQLSFLRNPELKRGSVTITEGNVVISFSAEREEVEPEGAIALDLNERNITTSDGQRYDLSEVFRIGQTYRRIRSSIQRRVHRDRRIAKALLSKYGSAEKERKKQAIHSITKEIVRRAREERSVIVMERLTHIRRSHARGNGEGKRMRGRMNSWCFREIQRQIEYKAAWEGVRVVYVRAANTSRTCSKCRSVNKNLTYERAWTCPTCGARHDRDLNAALNIMSRYLEAAAVRPSDEGPPREAMVLRDAVS